MKKAITTSATRNAFCKTKLVERKCRAETCERGWREHEEFFSKKISVFREALPE
jgi:hypothetical protein